MLCQNSQNTPQCLEAYEAEKNLPQVVETVVLEEDQKRSHRRIVFRAWCAKNRERRRASNLRYRLAHLDRVAASNRKQYVKNRTQRMLRQREYYKTAPRNKIAEREGYKRRYAKNGAAIRAQAKAWWKAHPEKHHAKSARRRARLRGADVGDARATLLIEKWRKAKSFVCYYCKGTFNTKRLHVDHITPISKGGKHTAENICAACNVCNLTKNDKLVSEFAPHGQTFLL